MLFQAIFLASPVLHFDPPTACKMVLSNLSTPAFLPVTRFHNRIQRSPLLTLNITFLLGWTAKALMPEGTAPGGAVSPLGRP